MLLLMQVLATSFVVDPRLMKTSKRKFFAMIVYGYKLLTISVTNSILDICRSPRSVSSIALSKILYETTFFKASTVKDVS